MILVDSREPKIFSKLIEKEGIKTDIQTLPVADYIIGNIAIERKDIRDLFSSLYSRRLFDQLYNLSKTDKPMLYIVGSIPAIKFINRRRIKLTKEEYQQRYATVKSIQATCWSSYGVNAQWVMNNSEFIEDLVYLYSKTSSKPSIKPVEKKGETIEEIKSNILCCIPTVGRVVADELSSKYSIHELSEFSNGRLSKLKISGRKIGKKAENIVKVLNE